MQANQGIMIQEPVQWLTVADDRAGQRLDNFLKTRLKGVPKTRIYQMIRKGEGRINKGRVRPDYKLKAGDLLRVPPVQRSAEPDSIDYRFIPVLDHIVYEDEQMIAFNKPAGLAVHGGSGLQGGLIEALRAHRPDAHYLELAHRLDRDTSGLLLIAKKRAFLRRFQAELREKVRLTKQYDLVVHGQWPEKVTIIDQPILKISHENGDRVSRIDAEGKPSKTIFKVKKRFLRTTWLSATLVTGRMHQIRVHVASQGCPIVGDVKYGHAAQDLQLKPPRMMLHATSLSHRGASSEAPGRLEAFRLEAPLEPQMKLFIESLHQ
ncbi:MAG: RluA family pseudouridine synthase [Proteobacteria bacterium]|nr:RluA family pseudouridine synthase [Pseudomonadota bacterium]